MSEYTHTVVRLISDDDGEPGWNPHLWHYVDPTISDPMILCTGEFFGEGQGGAVTVQKDLKSGGITCQDCLRKIKTYKAIKL